jgi:deazaflavin-dependent oxidoreductase (nitroreductase family)
LALPRRRHDASWRQVRQDPQECAGEHHRWRAVILIASNFGGSRNPAWYHKVEANPFVTLYVRGIRGRFIAEEIYDAERDRLFQRAKDAPGPYGQYEQAGAAQSRYVPVIAFYAAELSVRTPLWSTPRTEISAVSTT